MDKLALILLCWLESVSGNETKVTDCSRGGDQASNSMKYLVTPDYPGHVKGKLSCKWTINTNYGSHIKLVVETLDIPCRGNNGLKIIDTSRNNRIESVNFCETHRDSKVPMFVSTEVSFDLLLTIDSPLPSGARVKIGYVAKPTSDGIKVKDFMVPVGIPKRNIRYYSDSSSSGSSGLTQGFHTPSPGNQKPARHIIRTPNSRHRAQLGSSLAPEIISVPRSVVPEVRPANGWLVNPAPRKPSSSHKNASGAKFDPNSYEIRERFEKAESNMMKIIFGYIGIAILMICPIIFLIFKVTKSEKNGQENKDRESLNDKLTRPD